MAWYDVTGTVADWVMAGAALYASINAKRWFSQRSHTMGFDKAEKILANLDEIYVSTSEGLHSLVDTHQLLIAIDEETTTSNSSLIEKYENFAKFHDKQNDLINSLYDEIELIGRWSINIKNIHKINSLIISLVDANQTAKSAFNSARSCIYDINFISKDDFNSSFKSFKVQLEQFYNDLNTMDSSYEKFKRTRFVDFFELK